MLAHGLLEEARLVYANRDAYHTAAQAIGYKEFFPYFEGKEPLEVCTAALKRASRNYAKRQLTWFRRMDGLVWLPAGEPEAVNTVIQTYTCYIKYLSYFQGSINDDIQDYLKAQLMEALPKFRFDR